MSRRASLLAKQEKRKPRVRFPDELVFLDNIKGNDIQACHSMLRRASVQLDLNGLETSGLTPLHNAVLEGNLGAVKLLVQHGADINRQDADTWTPLHAACANGEADIARYLLSRGASKDIKTADGERPLDLCDARDFSVISVMLESDTARRARLLSAPDEGLEDDDTDGGEKDTSDHDDNNSEDGEESISGSDDNLDCDDKSPSGCPVTSQSRSSPLSKTKTQASRDERKADETSSLTKGLSKLKTSSDDRNTGTHSTRPVSQSPPKLSSTAPTPSPHTTRSKVAPKTSSPTHKSPTSTPKVNKSPSSSPKVSKSPSRSSPSSRKSPGVSPSTPKKNTSNSTNSTDSSGTSCQPRNTSKAITSRGSSNSSSGGGGGSGSSQTQAGITKTPKPPGHSILKKTTATHHCHTVAE